MVTLYSTPQCAPCRAAERQFDANNVEINKVDLTANPDILAELKERRNSDIIQTPLFEFDGELFDITGLRDVINRAKVAS